ncbi:hypothetical protein Gotur_032876 [Gossypium turneri]
MDWAFVQKSWEKWASSNIGSSGNLSQSFHYILFYLLICDWGLHCKLQAVTANLACSKIAGQPLKAALLINYDPLRPSRLLSTIFEADKWMTDMVTSIHENWFCARCLNTSKSAGEGAIVMQASVFLLVALTYTDVYVWSGILVVKASVFVRYDGSIGLASRAMASVDQLVWQLNRKNL